LVTNTIPVPAAAAGKAAVAVRSAAGSGADARLIVLPDLPADSRPLAVRVATVSRQ
jgi:hypothetical protein